MVYVPVCTYHYFHVLNTRKQPASNTVMNVKVQRAISVTAVVSTATRQERINYEQLYTVSQKSPTLKLFVTLSNLNRFSKFLH